VAYNDLREWIAALERAGELRRVKMEADPILEITEIADRVSKAGRPGQSTLKTYTEAGGPALLFENIKGQPGAKVLINQFGSAKRMKLALGVESLDEVAARIHQFMDVKSPQGLLDKIKMLPMLAEMGKFFPKTVSTGPCKEVVKKDTASLLDFPVLQCWPKDAGRFITLPCVITRDPKTGKRNMGMYRMQIYDAKTAGMHWQRQKIGAEHYREAMRAVAAGGDAAGSSAAVDIMARSSGGAVLADGPKPAGRMDVAVAIGTDPALTFSAIVPAPPDIEEYMIAGFLRQSPVELVKCETVDLEVPAKRRSSLKVTSSLTSSAQRDPSAITPASTRSPTSIRSSI
jgi:3-polyprenyl-4-hydroxybenzoate decarboxylase and related decarboxylases